MSADDSPDGTDEGDSNGSTNDADSFDDSGVDESGDDAGSPAVRERLEAEADRAIEGFDEGIVDLLSWILETETRARIYVTLRQHPGSTSDELAEETGLYPSTVREALAELNEEGTVTRGKRQNDGAGNNPYEYSAIPPSDLVGEMVEEVQNQLNTVFNLDDYLHTGDTGTAEEPVTITVTDEDESDDDSEDGDE